MSLKFNPSSLPLPFGLLNGGRSCCYFNSMIQCLMSCTALTDFLRERKDKYLQEGNQLALEYLELLDSVQTTDAYRLLLQLIRLQDKAQDKLRNLTFQVQDDASDALQLFLTTLDPACLELFRLNNSVTMFCGSCKLKNRKVEENEYTYNLVDLKCRLSTQEEVENYIVENPDVPEDYVCEACGAKNEVREEKVIPKVYRVQRMCHISEIFVCRFSLFNNQLQSTSAGYYPPFLEFPRKGGGKMTYRLVAVLDYHGTSLAGHYTCQVLRQKNRNLEVYCMDDSQETLLPGFSGTGRNYLVLYHLV